MPQKPRHPRLTRNRHVNEHLTFCALHVKNAADPRQSTESRKGHREAARAHILQAAHHFKVFR